MDAPTSINIDGVTLRIVLERKRVRHINARLRHETLFVSAPPHAPQQLLDQVIPDLARRLVRRVHARKLNAAEDALALVRKVAARFPSSCSRRATKRRFERMRPDSTSRHFSPSHLVPAIWFGVRVNCWMELRRLGLPGRLQRSADSLCLQSWPRWASSVGLDATLISAADARACLEEAVNALNAAHGARLTLPWQTLKRGRFAC